MGDRREAFAQFDRYAEQTSANGLPGNYVELLVVNDDGHEVRRSGAH